MSGNVKEKDQQEWASQGVRIRAKYGSIKLGQCRNKMTPSLTLWVLDE